MGLDPSNRTELWVDIAAAISAERIKERISDLGGVGSVEGGGVTRSALTEAEDSARRMVAGWLEPLGYACGVDSACNLVGRPPEASKIVIGSHLDSVPNGGRFDGALGVVGAVEVAEALVKTGVSALPWIAAWMGEEGGLFDRTLLGSAAALGLLSEDVWARDTGQGASLRTTADRWRSRWPGRTVSLPLDHLEAYLELHIEQGPALDAVAQPVAVVSQIVGISHINVTVIGRTDHAGTTPMDDRHDALAAAAEMALDVERLGRQRSGTAVATVGKFAVGPGAANVVPGHAQFTLDVRSPVDDTRHELVDQIRSSFFAIAASRDVVVEWSPDGETPAVEMDARVRRVLCDCARSIGIDPMELASGAVHDAQNWAIAGYATGMMFVRSTGGSHNPAEYAEPADAARGVVVVALAVCELTGNP